MLEALFLLVSYFFIATFDDCVFLLFFVQVDKMSPRNKKLEDEVSKDLSTMKIDQKQFSKYCFQP